MTGRPPDPVLRSVVRCVRPALRLTDHFGRYGGDEFMLILTDTGLPVSRAVAERLRQRVEGLRSTELGLDFRVTLSSGIAEYRSGEDIAETIRRADAALYQAKQTGRNRVMLAPAQTATVSNRCAGGHDFLPAGEQPRAPHQPIQMTFE